MPLHKKINAKEVDPNPNISFISVLKEEQDSDEALQIMSVEETSATSFVELIAGA